MTALRTIKRLSVALMGGTVFLVGLLSAIGQKSSAVKGGHVNRVLLVHPGARERRALSRALSIEGCSVCAAQDSGVAARAFLMP